MSRANQFRPPPGGFACRGCGACCRIPDGIVRVSPAEISRLARHLGVGEEAFIECWTDLAPDRRGLVLKSAPGGACALLSADNRCRVHPVKPDKCRTFPHAWQNPDSAATCPALREALARGGGAGGDTGGAGGGAAAQPSHS